MEFCTKRELQNQTGHGVMQWPLVVLKELVDNALDACEEAEVAPVISIAVEPGSIIIQDNAAGIKTSTIKSILDYTIRVSSREAYVSPTRGAQGNALKTILAMGYVLDRERQAGNDEAVGITVIETRGIEHRIEFRVDHINNEPKILHTTSPSPIKIGSQHHDQMAGNSMLWRNVAPGLRARRVHKARRRLCLVQPAPDSARFWVRQGVHQRCGDQSAIGKNGGRAIRPARTGTTTPGCSATSPLMSLGIAICGAIARCATSSPSSGAFRDRRSAQSARGSWLRHISRSRSSSASSRSTAPVSPSCWRRCASYSKPVAAKHLGVIGEDHLKQRFLAAGGNADTFKYHMRKGTNSRRHSHTSLSLPSACINPA